MDAKARRHEQSKFGLLAKTEGWRVSTVRLLLALILLFAFTPFFENLPDGNLVESGLITLVMAAALVAVAQGPRTLIAAAALIAPAIAAKWLHHFFPAYVSPYYFSVFGIAFFGFTIYRILRFILRTTHVDAEVLSAGIVVYLLLGLLWSQGYVLLEQLAPHSFQFTLGDNSASRMDAFNAFYFSFSTLTTAGFGDIAPASRIARTLAVMEAVTGVLYIAILISRLVGRYSSAAQTALSQHSDRP